MHSMRRICHEVFTVDRSTSESLKPLCYYHLLLLAAQVQPSDFSRSHSVMVFYYLGLADSCLQYQQTSEGSLGIFSQRGSNSQKWSLTRYLNPKFTGIIHVRL